MGVTQSCDRAIADVKNNPRYYRFTLVWCNHCDGYCYATLGGDHLLGVIAVTVNAYEEFASCASSDGMTLACPTCAKKFNCIGRPGTNPSAISYDEVISTLKQKRVN
jgi:hypothetical protein